MFALNVALLSTAWLFGPLQTGTAELRLGGAYAQADLSQASSDRQRQETKIKVGAFVGLAPNVWVGITLPHRFVRHGYQGRVFFDRSQFGAFDFEAAYQFDPSSFISVVSTLHLGDDSADFEGRFGALEDRFPTFDSSNTVGLRAGTIGLWDRWRWGLVGDISTPVTDADLYAKASAYGLFEPGKNVFSIGPTINANYSPNGKSLKVGLFERLGIAPGWSTEITVFTDLLTDTYESTTGVTGAIVWRG
jgi:hypothetical protein